MARLAHRRGAVPKGKGCNLNIKGDVSIMRHESNLLNSSLYLNKISLSKEIPTGNYLRNLPVITNLREMGELQLRKSVTFIVGENGVGKSTLIEGIAVALMKWMGKLDLDHQLYLVMAGCHYISNHTEKVSWR